MKLFFTILALFSIVGSIIYIQEQLSFENADWINDSPTLLSSQVNNIQFEFLVSRPSAIYWRVTQSPLSNLSPHDFTNTNTLSSYIAYGGNISRGISQPYTNHITNLTAHQQYILYSLAVSYIGDFPNTSTIRSNIFTTSN